VIPLGSENWAPIPQQLSSDQAEAIDNMMSGTKGTVAATMAPTVGILLITGGLSEIWGTVNSL